jgi:HK97 family phage prohead protease
MSTYDSGKPVYKAGTQSEDDPFKFIMSTPAVDRMGDIVEQDWDLRAFRKNPIALWAHKHDSVIGTWKGVKVVDNALQGTLQLAEKGTSRLIDMLRSLIEQRILRAVSVGFLPHKYEALDEDDPWGGYLLSDNELMECSLVSVPANPEALSLAKGLNCGSDLDRFLLSGVDKEIYVPAVKQLGTPKSSLANIGCPSVSVVQDNVSITRHDTKRISTLDVFK